MKKYLFLVFSVLFLTTSAHAATETYVNGIDPNYPPFAYIDATGKPAGFDVESMDWIAKKMGFEVTHKPVAWDGIIHSLLAQQIDMICSGMSITEVRSKQVAFSNPYWTVARVFIAKKDATLTSADILSKPTKLGIQRGTSEAEEIQKEKKEKNFPLTLTAYESSPLIVEDILNGRIDAGLMDALPADDAISKGKEVKRVGIYGKPADFGVAFRHGDDELRRLIEQGYKLLMADPHWKALQEKYLVKK